MWRMEPQVSRPEHQPPLWSSAVLSPSPPVMRMHKGQGPFGSEPLAEGEIE